MKHGWRWVQLLVVIAALQGPRALAQEWTRFRGPNGSGLAEAPDVPAQWSEKDYNWKVALPAGGHSSPVLWGDKIFLTCANDDTGERTVVCLNAGSGATLWKKSSPSHTFRKHQDNSYATSTPAVDEKHVYVCWSTPEALTLVALDHAGNEVWTQDLGKFISQHGGGQSPMVFRDKVFLGDDQEGPESFLFAFNCNNGEIAWKVARKASDKFSPLTPCIFHPRNGPAELIFASKAQGLTALDPETGHTVWELPDVLDARPISSPITAGGLIIASCGEGMAGGHAMIAARPNDQGTAAEIAYKMTRAVPYVPTPIVKDELLFYFADNGTITCARVATGEQVWKKRVDANFYGSPVCTGDKLFCLSKDGDVIVLRATDHFDLLAQNKLDPEDSAPHPPLATTPAIAGGRMYVRTYTHLYSIGGKR